jgi:hypothetical protein
MTQLNQKAKATMVEKLVANVLQGFVLAIIPKN